MSLAQLITSIEQYPILLTSFAKLSDSDQVSHYRNLCLTDLYFLLRYGLRLDKRFEHPWLFDRCREVQANPNGYLDLWSREHYKSTIITVGLTIQDILNNPEETFGIFSHTRPIAKTFLRQIKTEFQTNEGLKGAFPDILWQDPEKQAPKWSEDDGIIVKRKTNPRESTVEAWGLVDGQPIGKHFGRIVYDDVVVKGSVTSPEMITKTTEAYGLSTNLGTVGRSPRHVGTRYSFADTWEEVEKRGVKLRRYPATVDGTPEGAPVFWTQDQWDEKKIANGPANTACQLLQNPIAGEQAMFDIRDLQYYEYRPKTLNVYVLIDPARSQKKDSANTAMAVIGIDSQMSMWLLDGFNHKMRLLERWERMCELRKRWLNEPGVQLVRVGYETYGAQADMDYFEQEMLKPANPSFEIIELAWPREGEGSKIDRVQRLQPSIKKGKLRLPAPTVSVTSEQQRLIDAGEPYRIAKAIRKKDQDGNIYDLGAQLVNQIHFFPFGGLKDLVDAVSRIYDIEPTPPIIYQDSSLEPEVFFDS